MTTIEIAQNVAWFLQGAAPVAIAAAGLVILSGGRTNRSE
jgi:hypothetical protein